jgi:ribosome modulation factor
MKTYTDDDMHHEDDVVDAGSEACYLGVLRDQCPHVQGWMRRAWLYGFDQASPYRDEFEAGTYARARAWG